MAKPEQGSRQDDIAKHLKDNVGVTLPTNLGTFTPIREQGVTIEDPDTESAFPLHALQIVPRLLLSEGKNPNDVMLFSLTKLGLISARYAETGMYGHVLRALSVSGHEDWFPRPTGAISRATASNPLQQYFHAVAQLDRDGNRIDPGIANNVALFKPSFMDAIGHSKLLTVHLMPQLDVLAMQDWPATKETPTGLPVQMVASLNGYQQGLVTVEHWNSGELVRVYSPNFSLEVPAVLPQVPTNLSQLL